MAAGVGTATADGFLILQSPATADFVFYGEAGTGEVRDVGSVVGVLYPWAARSELSPVASVTPGALSYVSHGNNLRVLTDANLEIDPAFIGDPYTFEGPADNASSPKKLGFKKGDKIQLIGPVGGEPHDGKILTFRDPATISVYEDLDPSDTTLYQFRAFRRVP